MNEGEENLRVRPGPPEVTQPSEGDLRHTVVLADDAEDLRRLLHLWLEGSGRFRVVGQAGDGAEAVEQARHHAPRLVILDIDMPGLTGLDALPLIRAAAPDTKVVVLSSFEERSLGSETRRLGASGYLEKDLEPDALVERLLAFLREGGLEEDDEEPEDAIIGGGAS